MTRPFSNSIIWHAIDWLGEKTTIPEKYIYPVISLQWGFGSQDAPNACNYRCLFGSASDTPSLYMNGIVFFRFALPFYIGLQLKFSRDVRYQFGFGWKLNGRFTITIRRQSTDSAAVGMDGPNYGQAVGWEDGNT